MFCTKCGTRLEDNELECHSCGHDIDRNRQLDTQKSADDSQQVEPTSFIYNKNLVGGLLLVLFATCMLLVGFRYYQTSKYDIMIRRMEITQYPMLAMEIKIEGEMDDILEPENFSIEENGEKVNLVNFKPISMNRYLIEFAPDNLEQGGEVVEVEVIVTIDGIKHKGNVQYETPKTSPKWHTT